MIRSRQGPRSPGLDPRAQALRHPGLAPRVQALRHPGLDPGSLEMLKRVQHDVPIPAYLNNNPEKGQYRY